MPVYEYECRKCKHRFELIQKLSDPPPSKCPNCRKGTLQKLISRSGLHFKGSGWYVTDYARKGKSETKTAPAEGAKGTEGPKTTPPAKKETGSK